LNFQLPGWSDALAQAFADVVQTSSVPIVPGRVVRQDAHWLRVLTEHGTVLAKASGQFRHRSSVLKLPVVGDFVVLREDERIQGRALIDIVLPRKSLLARRGSDDGREGQSIAANVDLALLVVGLDRELSLRWLERAMTLVWNSGARPIVVLNKSDLVDPSAAVEEVSQHLVGAEWIAVSAHTGEGLELLRQTFASGETAALLGSSGAGKSSLTNALLGEHLAMQEGEVRASDAKGRHTTTHRELRTLPFGAFLIDGPGMRELGLWDTHDEGASQVFPEIQAMSAGCRFRDCTHAREPGCAVREAVESGHLDSGRYESFLKLRREQQWIEETATTEGRLERKRRQRILSQVAQAASRSKRRK